MGTHLKILTRFLKFYIDFCICICIYVFNILLFLVLQKNKKPRFGLKLKGDKPMSASQRRRSGDLQMFFKQFGADGTPDNRNNSS